MQNRRRIVIVSHHNVDAAGVVEVGESDAPARARLQNA
jgi:hypothetical protein